MIVEKLAWDSDFFGYEVGKIIINKENSLDFTAFPNAARKFKLVYVFSENAVDSNLFELVDEKVILEKSVDSDFEEKYRADIDIMSFDVTKHCEDELRKLALESGVFSRFYLDKNFVENEFERLYTRWIEESLNGKKAFDVLVATDSNNAILGFITLGKKNENSAEIGLVAVSELSRGKGIGKELLNRSFNKVKELGFKNIQVVTQNNNIPAMKLYQSAGFKIKEKTFVYHYWNL